MGICFWQPHRCGVILLLLVPLLCCSLEGAEAHGKGRKIFLQQCSKCHGREGEGVKGKYDDPLHGTRPLDKLTRYIEKSMPDDKPGTCVGEDATAVARYIYDSFYSVEARARKNPARVELARLTNRQYLTTLADLVQGFSGQDTSPGSERGLRARYFNWRDFREDKKAFDRVDRQIDFDFGEASPDKEHGTNEFSIQWRGSILADETGEYEFILKTPNGSRLWVNDDEEPLIDAWVASGSLDEHRATVRLLGGRAYPVQLNYFKFKDKTASISLQWKPPGGARQPIPARNLSPERTRPILVVTTPFPPDDSSVGYERGVAVSKAWDEATTQAAVEVANYVVARLDTLSGSKPADTNRTAKVQAFCEEFVARAFRRPLSAELKALFVTHHFKTAPKLEEAVRRVVLLALKSPRFLYLGLQDAKPDDFDRATRLSFALWDSLPDADLRAAAQAGQLQNSEQIAAQARRMLADGRARAKMQSFLHHWLQVDRASEPVTKDDKLFPEFTAQVVADLRTSLNLFLDEVVWSEASDYRTLLRADYLFVNDRLGRFYGVATNLTDDFVKVSFDAEQRSGVLTHPYLLATFSYPKFTSPIHRGVFLTRNIVGRALRPPPMAVAFKDADFAPNLTMREKVSELTRPQACQSCHSVINPLGFSLEYYDAVGRFRTQDNERPVNAASDYVTDEGKTVRLAGARDVASFALDSEQAQNAFIEQLFHHVVKQPAQAYGGQVIERLRHSFVASQFNLQKLLADIAVLSASWSKNDS